LFGERGSALAVVLVLIVVLTVAGAAMVNNTLTEISVAYNAGDAVAAQYAAEAGLSRAIYELSQNAGWTGTTAAIGDGQYVVTVTSSGSVRSITSTGTRGGGRRVLKAAMKAVPQSAVSTVLANTTATIGSATTGLTVSNNFPSSAASAAHANNKLAAATAMTVNTAGATVIGGLTANGTISGVTCATWAWTCNASASVRAMPELNMDGTTPTCDSSSSSSYKCRAQNTTDPADGKNLYFRGGDATSRCNSGGAWTFTATETQRCWDYYVSQRTGTIGQNISNGVFFVEFNPSEATTYTTSGGGGGIAFRAARNDGWNGLGSNNGIHVPAGLVDGDVMLAAISWSDGTSETISTPAAYALNTTDSTLPAGADFTKELGDYTADISLPVSVAANATEDSFAYTKAGVPGASGVAGDYWVTFYVPSTNPNSNIMVSTAVVRVNSAGAMQASSTFSGELSGAIGNKSFTFTSPSLGTWSSGDRLRVTYRFRNTLGTVQSITIATPVAGVGNYNMVRAPWASGWTLVRRIDNGTSAGLAIYWKVASNEGNRICVGQTGACYDWKFSPGSGSQSMTGAIVAYSGVDTIAPINIENGQTTARSTSHSTPSITTTVANTMVVATFAVGGATATTNQWTPPAGMTERSDSGAQAVALGVDDQLQATAGATGVKTATATKSAVGATHILALKPGGGAVTVNCPGYLTAVETLCIRATPASIYANSVLTQVTGAIVGFRRVSGTTVAGDIAFENIAQASANYAHSSSTGAPALVAGGKVVLYSSGSSAGRSNTNITGLVYTFADTDNPTSGNLQGAGTGTVYVLKSANSDLTGGADFNKELYPGSETAGTIAVSVAASATDISYGFTKAGEPGLSGVTGNYTVEMNVTVANSNIQLSAAVARVNSAGAQQAISSFTAEQSAGTTGVKTFSFTGIDLGTWASGDRLRVSYKLRNAVASVQSVTIGTGTTSAEATAPWTVGVDVQHGADTIALTFSGILLSNGSISLQDTGGTGSAIIRYDSAVVNNLPAAFTASTANYILIPISWSSGD